MLPFLKKKQEAGISSGILIKHREPDNKDGESNDSTGIEECARALIRCVHANDAKGVAEAMKDAFDILENGDSDSQEPSPFPHSYEDQQEE